VLSREWSIDKSEALIAAYEKWKNHGVSKATIFKLIKHDPIFGEILTGLFI
jgi:hypothetical protein